MKKAILILVALLLVTVAAIPVLAADTEVTISAATDICYAGDQVTLTINVSGKVPYTLLKAQILFDENVFEYVSYQCSDDVPADIYRFNVDKKTFVLTFREPTAYEGEIGTVTLRVKQGASLEPSAISVNAEASDTVSDPEKDITLSITGNTLQLAIGCRHSYTWVKTDDDNHTGTCSNCGAVKPEAHTWADESINITPATCTDPGSETLECLLCQTQKTVDLPAKGHAWDSDCDPDCNNGCGETRQTGHRYETEWTSDENKHWHACSVCGDKADAAAHVPGAAATETTAQICTECDYVIQAALGHIHEFETTWQQDGQCHWRICIKKGCYYRQDVEDHQYTDDCDVTCNVCGHVRVAPHNYSAEWRASALGHWHDCLGCGMQSDMLTHVPGAAATQDTPQVCTECQYWLKYPLSHEHTFSELWGHNDENHWKYCTVCSERADEAPHDWDEGTVLTEPSQAQDGTTMYTCKTCGAERVENVSNDPTEPTTDPTEPSSGTDPEDTQPVFVPVDTPQFPWWILIVLAGVLLVTGIVLFIIELIRGKSHNSHGKYSK